MSYSNNQDSKVSSDDLISSENSVLEQNSLESDTLHQSSQPDGDETDGNEDVNKSNNNSVNQEDSSIQICSSTAMQEDHNIPQYDDIPQNSIASQKASDDCSKDDFQMVVSEIEHSPCDTVNEQHQGMPVTTSKPLGLSSLCEMHLNTGTYFKGCKWAPDGLCLMSCSNDNVIRLINTPKEIQEQKWDHFDSTIPIESCLDVREAEIIYDYAWWPHMNSMHPNTCCFVSTSKDQPIHLWDAFNGKLRASYIAKNHVDEVSSAYCLGFSPDGMQLIGGFSKCLRLFYIDRPGTSCETWPTRKHRAAEGQRGIISTCEFSPDGATVACGSYDGTVGLYSSKNGDLSGMLHSNNRGVTQVQFSPDGNRIYSGSRMDNDLICWDVRYMACDLFHLTRKVQTNQRIYFDIGSRSCVKRESTSEEILVSGGTDGNVMFWDIPQNQNTGADKDNYESFDLESCCSYQVHKDCVNGVSIHPFLPVLATSSGQRHYNYASYFSDVSDSDSSEIEIEENCLKLWKIENWRI